MYLGHHWSHRREQGEPQITFNYVAAFSDFIVNFCFGRGVYFRTPDETSAIVPSLLSRVWEVDNDKASLLWEMGNQGSVSGDCFVKIAYEEPWVDPANNFHAGRVRILPLNSAFVFPEWHPHDRSRLLRVKMKYKFWGTAADGTRQVFTYTELLTDTQIEEYINDQLIDARPNPLGVIPVVPIPNIRVSGSPWGLSNIGHIIALNRQYNETATEIADIVNYHCVDEQTEVLTRLGWKRYDEVTAGTEILCLDPDSNEIDWRAADAVNVYDYDGHLVAWDNHVDALTTPNHRWLAERRLGRARIYHREMVRTAQAGEGECAAAQLTQGSRIVLGGGLPLAFAGEQKYVDEFVELIGWMVTEGCLDRLPSGSTVLHLHQSERMNAAHVESIRRVQAYWQRQGATFTEQRVRDNGVVGWYVGTELTAALLAVAPGKAVTPEFVTSLTYQQAWMLRDVLIDADGHVRREKWYQDDRGRRDGYQMLSAMLGIRTRSYDNCRGDGVVDAYQRSTILVEHTVPRAREVRYQGKVWCPTVPTGVWMARRNGNTYWTGNSAPVTVITGAKASQLEKGPKKVWGGLPKDAQVFNLELGNNLQGPLDFLALLKKSMHELTGVPEGALGDVQPISNTSGVALAIQYTPMMQRYRQITTNYAVGIRRINELVLRTLAVKEPLSFQWDPSTNDELKDGQLPFLDPADPISFQSECHWPPPLPVDILVKLNEVQLKMGLGLESKRGALRELGEEFPDEKAKEIFLELLEDAVDQGALDMLRAQIQASVMAETGMVPGPDGPMPQEVTSAGGSEVTSSGTGGGGGSTSGTTGTAPLGAPPEIARLTEMLNTRAYGTKLAQRRNPENDD